MEGTVVEEELREEFGIVERNIDEIECSLGRENVGESEEDFVAAESSYDYDDLFNFEVSVAIAETLTARSPFLVLYAKRFASRKVA